MASAAMVCRTGVDLYCAPLGRAPSATGSIREANYGATMISAANVTVQFGEKPLFEDVSVKFGNGHRYGLIGANGSGKTTLLKVLGGEVEPTHGNVSVEPNVRLGKLRQDQFAFEEHTVIHTVIMGHERLWQLFQERERLYAQPSLSE